MSGRALLSTPAMRGTMLGAGSRTWTGRCGLLPPGGSYARRGGTQEWDNTKAYKCKMQIGI